MKEKKYLKHFKIANLRENILFNRINVIEQDKLPEDINLKLVLKKIQTFIPEHFLGSLDSIYIGNFSFLKDRNLNAIYKDGAIYVSPMQDNDEDLLDDIVHEIAHCVEDNFGIHLYEDGKIEEEFVRKRLALYNILISEGYKQFSKHYYLQTEYSKDFDEFLYVTIGYPALTYLTANLYVSPYGATSLREYFANCFEEYFARNNFKEVKNISPSVYEKIDFLLGFKDYAI